MGSSLKRKDRDWDGSEGTISDDDSEPQFESRSEEETEEEYTPIKPKKSPQKKPRGKTPKVPKLKINTKASIVFQAQVDDSQRENLDHVDKDVLGRIIKALSLADHADTGEHEAKAALRMAHKLMSTHSVAQAAVLAHMKSSDDRLKQAGSSSVALDHTEGKRMNLSSWICGVAHAMEIFFDCKHYTESTRARKDRITFVFYGLAEQTVAAAHAFEMVYNLIVTWREQQDNVKSRNQKNSYCIGVANGLQDCAEQEKEEELKKAQQTEQRRIEATLKAEENDRKRELDRLRDSPPRRTPEASSSDGVRDVRDEDLGQSCGNQRIQEVQDEDDVKKENSDAGGLDPFESHDWGCDDEDSHQSEGVSGGHVPSLFPALPSVDAGRRRRRGEIHADFESADIMTAAELDALADEVKARQDERKKAAIPSMPPPPPPKPPVVKEEAQVTQDGPEKPKDEPEESPWKSSGQLIQFRHASLAVADDWLAERKKDGFKLYAGRKRNAHKFKDAKARDAYEKGKEDAKKIDVRGKRIMEHEEDFVY